jgi:hypothetical protein
MRKLFSFYDLETGVLHAKQISYDAAHGHEDLAIRNTPSGHGFIEGHYDHLSQRVDVHTKMITDYQPPMPSKDHEWNTTTKRWQLNAAAQARLDSRRAALAEIARLESMQPRALREVALKIPGGTDKLASIEAQIQTLRTRL